MNECLNRTRKGMNLIWVTIDSFLFLPNLSKVLETIHKDQIVALFESKKIFLKNHFGLRSDMSTKDVINYLTKFAVRGLEEGKYVGASFCDLSKAFDCVPFDALIYKLGYYNFRQNSEELSK